MNKNTLCRLPLAVIALAGLLLAACSGGGGGGGGQTAQPQGTLRVALTDAPACGFTQVNVTVNRVRVHQSSSANPDEAGWTDIALSPGPRKIDLLSLNNGVLLTLGQAPLPAGRYSQLRLLLVPNTTANPLANSVIPEGGVETPLTTPSGVESGIKLVHQFDVAAGQQVDLVLDFDACKSVVTRGNGAFNLKPVITVVPTRLSGIVGFVDPAISASKPFVTAQLNGVVVDSTVPDATTGEFRLLPLLPSSSAGLYTVVVTADGRTTVVIAGVPVVAESITTVSGSGGTTPPISLPPSLVGTASVGTVGGNALPVSAEAVVRATQSLAPAGPTVITVKSQAADLITAAYSLTLPLAAPLLGQFGSGTLPVAFSQVLTAAGKYTIEASASGFQTQSVPVTLTALPLTQNFTLVPSP